MWCHIDRLEVPVDELHRRLKNGYNSTAIEKYDYNSTAIEYKTDIILLWYTVQKYSVEARA